MGHQYEHEIANGIEDVTPQSVRSYRCGYSGNSKHPQPDVLVTEPNGIHALELKKRSGDKVYVDGEDLEMLVECTNFQTRAWLVVKFPYHEPVSVRHFKNDDYDVPERFARATPEQFEPTVTDGGNLRLTSPQGRDVEWPSSRSGDDDEVSILKSIGFTQTEEE